MGLWVSVFDKKFAFFSFVLSTLFPIIKKQETFSSSKVFSPPRKTIPILKNILYAKINLNKMGFLTSVVSLKFL